MNSQDNMRKIKETRESLLSSNLYITNILPDVIIGVGHYVAHFSDDDTFSFYDRSKGENLAKIMNAVVAGEIVSKDDAIKMIS